MLLERFNDENYDGIVIKLPTWFIDLNKAKLQPALDALKTTLSDDSILSYYHPDRINSAYELTDYASKASKLEADKQQQEERRKKTNQRAQDLIDLKIIPIVWKDKGGIADREFLTVKMKDEFDTHLEFDVDEIFTTNGHPMKSFLDKFDALLPNIDIEKFAMDNGLIDLTIMLNKMPTDYDKTVFIQNFFRFNGFNISRHSWNIRVKYQVPFLQKHILKKGKTYIQECHIGFNDGNLSMLCGNRIEPHVSLENYTFNGREFIKK